MDDVPYGPTPPRCVFGREISSLEERWRLEFEFKLRYRGVPSLSLRDVTGVGLVLRSSSSGATHALASVGHTL